MSLRPSRIQRAYTGADWLTLDEAKAHLRVDWSEDDSYIESLLEESAEYVESYLGRPVRATTLTLTWGPVSVAPRYLIAPHLEPGSTLDTLTVDVGGAGASPQAYRDQPLFDRALREAIIELDPPPSSVDADNRAVFAATLSLPSPAELRPALRRARLLFVGEMYEKRMGEANLDAVEAVVAAHRVLG